MSIEKYLRDKVSLQSFLEQDTPELNISREHGSAGLVPNQIKIRNHGFTLETTPREFLDLVPERPSSPGRIREIIEDGKPIGPPFLIFVWIDDKEKWYVSGHEGRGRMMVISDLFGPRHWVETDIFTKFRENLDEGRRSISADQVTETMKNNLNRIIPEYLSPPLKSWDEESLEKFSTDFNFRNLQL